MNVLAVDLPMLIDTDRAATFPRLTSYDMPPLVTEPLMAKAMLVPFTAIGLGEAYSKTHDLHWMVSNSPFVRTERVLRWRREFWQYNTGSVEQNPSITFKKGITVTDSDSFSTSVGISLTAGGGVEYAVDRWVLGAEYLYVDLGSYDWSSMGNVALTDPILDTDWSEVKQSGEADLSFSVARATLKYRF